MVTAVSVVGRGAFGSRNDRISVDPGAGRGDLGPCGDGDDGSSGSSGSASAPAMMAGTSRNRL